MYVHVQFLHGSSILTHTLLVLYSVQAHFAVCSVNYRYKSASSECSYVDKVHCVTPTGALYSVASERFECTQKHSVHSKAAVAVQDKPLALTCR